MSESIAIQKMIGLGFNKLAQNKATTNATDLAGNDVEATLLSLGDVFSSSHSREYL